jgi:hypothetical protein
MSAWTGLPGSGFLATVRLFVVGGFGQPRSGCRVDSLWTLDEPRDLEKNRELKTLFTGLEARRVPYVRIPANPIRDS